MTTIVQVEYRVGVPSIRENYCSCFCPAANTVQGPAFISRSNGFCQANSGWRSRKSAARKSAPQGCPALATKLIFAAKALVEAHRRGVKVEVVLDRSQRTEKYSSATFVRNEGIPCFIDAQHAIAHNKVMVIDGLTVITGSFNFTKAAEANNAENLLVIQDTA